MPRGAPSNTAPPGRPQASLGDASADRRSPASQRAPVARLPLGSDDRWPAFSIFVVADDCTRERLAFLPNTSRSGTRVAREARLALRCARRAQHDRERQWDRADEQCHPAMGRRSQDRLALHCAWYACAEPLHRELQRATARRTLKRDPGPLAPTNPHNARILALRLQQNPHALAARMDDPHKLTSVALRPGDSSADRHRPTGHYQ